MTHRTTRRVLGFAGGLVAVGFAGLLGYQYYYWYQQGYLYKRLTEVLQQEHTSPARLADLRALLPGAFGPRLSSQGAAAFAGLATLDELHQLLDSNFRAYVAGCILTHEAQYPREIVGRAHHIIRGD